MLLVLHADMMKTENGEALGMALERIGMFSQYEANLFQDWSGLSTFLKTHGIGFEWYFSSSSSSDGK